MPLASRLDTATPIIQHKSCVHQYQRCDEAGSRRCATACLACAEFDASVMLVRNTPWARGFFRKAHQAQQHPAAMSSVLAEDVRLHGERNTTLEQVTSPAPGCSLQCSSRLPLSPTHLDS
jgi:hypothetical protein